MASTVDRAPQNAYNHIIRGAGLSGAMASMKFAENSIKAGANYQSAAVLQGFQLSFATELFLIARRAATEQMYDLDYILNFKHRIALIFIPQLMARITTLLCRPDGNNAPSIARKILKKTFVFAQEHIGDACQVATLVSVVALFYFGFTYYATTFLSTAIIEMLDQSGSLLDLCKYFDKPELAPKLARGWHTTTYLAQTTTGLIWEGMFIRTLIMVNLIETFAGSHISYLLQKSIRWFQGDIDVDPVSLSRQEIAEINDSALGINLRHFKALPELYADITNLYEDLQSVFAQIAWDNPAIKERYTTFLCCDEKYNASTSGDNMKMYLKKSFTDLLAKLKNRTIKDGQVYSYSKTELQLAQILRMLNMPAEPDAEFYNQKISTLIILAAQGNYCGPGVFEIIERERDQLSTSCPNPVGSSIDNMPRLQYLFLHHYYMARKHRFDSIFQKITAFHRKYNPLKWIFPSPVDRHDFNYYNKLIGESFGVNLTCAENDRMIQESGSFFTLTMRLVYTLFLRMENYSAENLLSEASDKDSEGKIPAIYVQEWLDYRNQRQPNEAPLILNDLYDQDGRLSKEFLKSFLIEIGVLRILPN